MGLISFLFLIQFTLASELPRFLTKYPIDTLKFISKDGRTVYTQKKSGVLSLINGFNSIDFLSEPSQTDFIVMGSDARIRLAIEAIPNAQTEFNLLKNHQLYITNWGNPSFKKIGTGKDVRLHLKDEWITFYDGYKKIIHIQNLITDKKFQIQLALKSNPFFTPDVIMLASDNVTYTEINENGFAALISYNLSTKISSIIYKANQTGTRLELCRSESYLGIGEFPYEGLKRGSKIMHLPIGNQTNLAGYTTIYSSVDHDIGNLICRPEHIYFIKTVKEDEKFRTKTTDVFQLDTKSQKLVVKTTTGNITQMINMDGRILIPFRGDFFIIEGENNLSRDNLKNNSSQDEELPLDI
jgi:hypothetical protein